MNCGHFQERLYDYLDDTLSPPEKAAADDHLLGCRVCRQAIQSELMLARTISNRLKQAVEPVALDANARRAMARAVERSFAQSHQQASVFFWLRLAMPFAALALILMSGIWISQRVISRQTEHLNKPNSVASRGVVSIHFSYSVPDYTFRKEGTLVVDALTPDTRSIDGALRENEGVK
jgi:anti-sigma factor RsiW